MRGDQGEAKFREYKDLRNGVYLNNATLLLEKPDSARFFEAVAGAFDRDDQYVGVNFGRYNSWKIKSFYKETSHVFTSNYRSLWNGVGSSYLALRGLPAGGTANAATTDINIGNIALQTPYSSLSVVREKGGVRLDMRLRDRWNVYASYTGEERKGARPFGLVSGAGGGTGGVETPESVNYYTADLLAGLQYTGVLSSLNVALTSSMFHNRVDTLTIENPMFLAPGAGITGVGSYHHAVFDLYPDNKYYNAKAEYARTLPNFFQGQFTAVVSTSSSQQNERLIPYAPYAGLVVNGVAGGSWNTTASLSRPTAGTRIDSDLVDLTLALRPVSKLDVRAKVRHYQTENDLDYQACNPLTGQWGRLINDGTGAAIVNTAAYLAPGVRCNIAATAALGVVPSGGNLNLRAIPYAQKQLNASLNADYRIGGASTLNASFERERVERAWRERDETTENRLRVGFVTRALKVGTLRISAETDRRRGSVYNPDPYSGFYSVALGPLPTATGTAMNPWLRTNDLHRKYDLADRDQNVLNLRFNVALAQSVDLSASFQVKDMRFPDSSYGRTDHQKQNSANVELNWQPMDDFGVYGSYSHQSGKMQQAGLQPNACVIGTSYNFLSDGVVQTTPLSAAQIAAGVTIVANRSVLASNFQSLCGTVSPTSPLYPTSRTWVVQHDETSEDLTVGGNYDFGKARFTLNYTYSNASTAIGYTYNATALGFTPAQVALMGNGFPDITYRKSTVESSLVVPLSKRLTSQLYYRYEAGKIRDWHYDGIAQNPTPSNNQMTFLDAGPQDYNASVVGLFFTLSL